MVPIAGEHLLLVRHARPAVDPAVPSEHWELGPDGRAAARALRPRLPSPGSFVASPEPKARQTLEEVADEVAIEAGFAEVRRPYVWGDDYRGIARAYVEGVRHDGWEAHQDVIARFDAAVVRHASIAAARNTTLIVGTHGLAPTVWLASRYRLEPNPATFWAALQFPDVIEVDLTAATVSRRG
jgi:broad specificity phosphatase PhoE